ncbi:MAG: transcription-repair coupling factor [Verrucomicrobia bacterium]|nr:transcription-repair coupling factor [Verrucomicrobiota bacterium]MDI9382467.1 transcription-repair coupling factor [Verrucomicrobiota bacterium]NMD19032.1 transcription-repair coupling factor [Verrucomicrobiota bacterium]HOA60963.1 transcription-repair coupling factor [Verrucomicrobiota bacterium]HOG86928.1 transcription-repair coupling factor [Verrucomicrobiota bacterium]
MTSESSPRATRDVVALINATPPAQAVAERIAQGGALSLNAVASSAWPFVSALLRRQFPHRPIVVVTTDLKAQESLHQDIQTWLTADAPTDPIRPGPSCRALFYPAWESLPHQGQLPHADIISERLETLVALAEHRERSNRPRKRDRNSESESARSLDPGSASSLTSGGPEHPPAPVDQIPPAPLVVTSVGALLQRTFPSDWLRARHRVLRRGDSLAPLDLIEWLEDQAYEPEAQVTQKGELALRGGIVDVFPLTSPWPVRLEFFGDTLESLRLFDPQTQISREEIEQITLAPAGEIGLLRQLLDASAHVASARDANADALPAGPTAPAQPQRVSAGSDHPAAPFPVSEARLASFLDHLGPDALVVFCDPIALDEQAERYAEQIPPGDPFHVNWHQVQADIEARALTRIALFETEFGQGAAPDDRLPGWTGPALDPTTRDPNQANMTFTSLDVYRPLGDRQPDPEVAEAQRRQFFTQLHRWLRQGFAVEVFCNNTGEQQRLSELCRESGLAELETRLGTLSRGFLCDAARVVVVTDAEIFGRYKVQRPRRLKSPHAVAMRSAFDIDFTDLAEGDYVVHLQYGIGRYLGLQRLPSGRGRKGATTNLEEPGDGSGGEECLVIEYAPGGPKEDAPKLYVPVTESHLVSKYVGAGRARPPLNTLSGSHWLKAKAQANAAVRDFAAELLRLQAARSVQSGFAFPPDAPWQLEFESAFVYEETPDQLRAIEATKQDLERPRPMDRLICGDVGFGKTEVAIRAAFKVVLAGRQVAVLVPTTVLAHQHYNTFRERMAGYPIRIELLSRFRTRRQQNRIVRDLAVGGVDIVIGTHRLVQPDVVFKDLGLVVIDEEQRFGVAHKERLKRLRQMVDVLTLSATPIPRTLYLALMGARDMSTIETPPQDRLPVETVIAPYDERLIRDAIRRELNRGGQVFYLHNRILDIEAVAKRLGQLVPQARLAVGHGQMHADALEEVMTQFVNGEIDVLLSTTIIESGIDIPNANTIIIDRADRFGLGDLYQLRGRVGRYKHQAYAYLLIPRHAGLLADARKRISAVRQFSSPGSGFKIAMRDLEIRGAGNLLGPEQSGHITAVGFELYCRLLKHSIAALNGEPLKPLRTVSVRFDFLDLSPVGHEESDRAAPVSPATHEAPQPDAPPPARMDAKAKTTPPAPPRAARGSGSASACLPLRYVPEPHHRIEMYRKLAQVTDKAGLDAVRSELRDRFGPPPPAVELLVQVSALKILAADRGLDAMETRDDRLMLTRNGQFIQVGGRFPRLTKKTAAARLNEIRKILLALEPCPLGRVSP